MLKSSRSVGSAIRETNAIGTRVDDHLSGRVPPDRLPVYDLLELLSKSPMFYEAS